jgi:thiosulfate/3-mercaptopyruvate sulfurtransferase
LDSNSRTRSSDEIPVQVATGEQFAATMRRAGIGDEHLVVVYDTHPAATFAPRLWWALRYYGHTEVVLLNGGLANWQREGRAVEAGAVANPSAVFTPKVQPQLRAAVGEVLAAMREGTATLVDARDPGQYTGAIVRPGNRRGHIPGAINIPREDLVDLETATWRSPEEIAGILAAAGLTPDHPVIAYCNGDVASTAVQFGMAIAEYPAVATYDGSWNEWSARDDLPVEGG